jgi:hypothetical protein
MAKSDRTTDTQYGALPYRAGPHGLEIMLIISRGSKRWVVPKGWPMIGRKPHRVAEIEAFQEAGVKGVVAKKPIGAYPYTKVYPLHVTLEALEWREKPERKRMWLRAEEAVDLVDEGGLALIIEEWRRLRR